MGEYMPFAVENISRTSAWVVLVFLTNLICYATPFPYCCVQHVILAQNVQSNSSTSHTVAKSMQNVQHNKLCNTSRLDNNSSTTRKYKSKYRVALGTPVVTREREESSFIRE